MNYRYVTTAVVPLLLAGSLHAATEPETVESAAREDAKADIRGLIATYAKSVDAADPELASTIWANTPDVSFIHPRGHEHGWDAVKANVYQKAMGETFSERKLTVRDVAIHTYGDTAWAEFYWDFVARLRKDGSPLTTHGRETQVYKKADGRWRLVHVHYSGMPVTGERRGF
jgi:uncharacterized protein (TIGR02246 family)